MQLCTLKTVALNDFIWSFDVELGWSTQ